MDKKSSQKSSSSSKSLATKSDRLKWNIPPEPTSQPSSSSAQQQQQAMDAMNTSSKISSAIDSLFDSGYDSQTVSKTSIDFDTDSDTTGVVVTDKDKLLFMSSPPTMTTTTKWTDSGVCITSDSGLDIGGGEQQRQQDICDMKSQTTTKLVSKLTSSSSSGSDIKHQSSPSTASRISALVDAFGGDQDDSGDTFLHLSIIKSLEDMSYAFIRFVPHPDVLDISNRLSQTPLHLAALTRQSRIVRQLVISGATLDLRDRHGNTALHIACAQSDYNTCYQLLAPVDDREIIDAQLVNYPVDSRPDIPIDYLGLKNYEGETCLHLAAYNNNKNIIELLVNSGGLDVNIQELKSGKTILHWSVETQNLDLIKFLINRCKADVRVRSYANYTPVQYAYKLLAKCGPNNSNTKLKTIIRYLTECGADYPIDDTNNNDSSDDDDYDYDSDSSDGQS
ncbi:NF-kappa-B inhibitor cactus-like [Oppia nitens]|uniref:NF-kappa-B inhibitor cactus-like n=1 Tax=Oppia nitens TaxID=1686743 RepID=UPI0023DB77CD|nr:NF-kappa-B inhibitor cactus-like [Oppia nitens]